MARDAGAGRGHRPDRGHAATQRDVRGAPQRRTRRRARRPGRRRGGAHGGPTDGPARAGAAAIGPAGGDRARVLRGAHPDGDRRAAQAAARDGEDAHPARARAAARGRQAHDMNHEPFDTLAAAYALGALDGEELVEFEAHLAQECARCAVTLRESYEALAALARSAPPAVPPPEVKQALLSRIAAVAPTASPRRERGRGSLPWVAGAAAAAAAAAEQDVRVVDDRGGGAEARGRLPGRCRGAGDAPRGAGGGRQAREGLRRHARAGGRRAGTDRPDGPRVGEVARASWSILPEVPR